MKTKALVISLLAAFLALDARAEARMEDENTLIISPDFTTLVTRIWCPNAGILRTILRSRQASAIGAASMSTGPQHNPVGQIRILAVRNTQGSETVAEIQPGAGCVITFGGR